MAGARKSLNEIKEVLAKMGIHLGMETPGWPPENIEELIKFFAIFADKTLRDMDFSVTDGEIKSVVETGMDDYLSLLLSKKSGF